MSTKTAKANVVPVRQRTQYSCMSASMAMCLRALGHEVTEDEVNQVMGARPMRGAAWEQALACAQHYGCRATLTMPCTVEQLKQWTDAGIPVMIAWNPEGRDWSHASVVFDVDDEMNVYVADPNIPNPKKTVRVVSEDEFYGKWSEKFPDYLVRRPACAIEREITVNGENVRMASSKTARIQWAPLRGGGKKYVTPELIVHVVSETETYTEQDRRVPDLHEVADPEMLADGVPSLMRDYEDIAKQHAQWVRQGWWPRPATRKAWKVYVIHRPTRQRFESDLFAKEGEALKKAEEAIPKILNRKRPLWLAPITASEAPMSTKTAEEYDRMRDRALERGTWKRDRLRNPKPIPDTSRYTGPSIIETTKGEVVSMGVKIKIKANEFDSGLLSLSLDYPLLIKDNPVHRFLYSHSRKDRSWTIQGRIVANRAARLRGTMESRPKLKEYSSLDQFVRETEAFLSQLKAPSKSAATSKQADTPLQDAIWAAWDQMAGVEKVQSYDSTFGCIEGFSASISAYMDSPDGGALEDRAYKLVRKNHRIERQSRSWRAAYNLWREGKIDIDLGRLAVDLDKTRKSLIGSKTELGRIARLVKKLHPTTWAEAASDYEKAMMRLQAAIEAFSKAISMAKAGKMARGKKKPQTAPKTQEQRDREKKTVKVRAPKKRDEAARALAERGGTGAGKHKNKAQRGKGTKGKGKAQRHPKHRGQARWAVEKLANRFLHERDAAYSGNPDGKPIYDVEVDHGEHQALAGGTDVMKRLQDRYLVEQGSQPREKNPRLASAKITPEEYDALRPGKRIFLTVSGPMTSGEMEFQVGRTTYSKKYDVFSKTLYPVEGGTVMKRGRAKWVLFKRPRGVSLSHGGMGVALKSVRMAASKEAGRRLDNGLRRKVNEKLLRVGLDGNGRFRKPEQGFARAVEVMQEFGIEMDEVVSSHLFSPRPQGTVRVDLAFSNPSDPFSPESITNSLLFLQYTELDAGRFEVTAYLS